MDKYSLFQREPVTIEEEFEKNPELTHEALRHLSEWVEARPHFPEISEKRLALFLHSCHYNLELTKETIEKNIELRSKWPQVFQNRDPFSIVNQGSVHCLILPKKTKEGYRVIFTKLTRDDVSAFDIEECLKMIWMTGDLLDHYEGTNNGVMMVMECGNVPFGILRKLQMSIMRKSAHYLDYCLPVRYVCTHYINISSVIPTLLSLVTPFLKRGYEEKMQLHSTIETLYKFVPKEILPIEYGGSELTYSQMAAMTEELRQKAKDWFASEEKQRIDESLRPRNTGRFLKWFGF